MDKVELSALEWFDELIQHMDLIQIELDEALPDERKYDRVRALSGEYSEDVKFIARHYSRALRDRASAFQNGDFELYVKSTYALCQDWREVLESVQWADWGCRISTESSAIAAHVRTATVLACGAGPLTHADLLKSVRVFARANADEVLSKAIEWRLLQVVGGVYTAGDHAPIPKR